MAWPSRGHLEQQLTRVLDRQTVVPDVQRFVAHLDREWGALFGFLHAPAVDATNWRAEQAIRPAVITRKVNAAAIGPRTAPLPSR